MTFINIIFFVFLYSCNYSCKDESNANADFVKFEFGSKYIVDLLKSINSKLSQCCGENYHSLKKAESILKNEFNLNYFAEYLFGHYWKKIPLDIQEKYLKILNRFLAIFFVIKVDSVAYNSVLIKKVFQNKEFIEVVGILVHPISKKPLNVIKWKINKKENRFVIEEIQLDDENILNPLKDTIEMAIFNGKHIFELFEEMDKKNKKIVNAIRKKR